MFVALAYLCLDAYSYGVFTRQPGMPGVVVVRSDTARMHQFADLNIRLNGERGVPRLAKAEIARRELAPQPLGEDINEVVELYRRAIEVDPWNAAAYVGLFEVNVQYGLADGSENERLLGHILRLAPQNAQYAVRAIKFYANRDIARATQIGLEIGQWCEFLAKRDRGSLDELGKTLAALNTRASSPELEDQLAQCHFHFENSQPNQRMATVIQNWLIKPD